MMKETKKSNRSNAVENQFDAIVIRRELKFRAYSKDGMELIDDLYWFEENGVRNGAGDGHYRDYNLMEFSGLQDSRGNDIYEDDVIYLAGFGMYKVVFPFLDLYDAMFNGDIGEIKGNIYENQELNVDV